MKPGDRAGLTSSAHRPGELSGTFSQWEWMVQSSDLLRPSGAKRHGALGLQPVVVRGGHEVLGIKLGILKMQDMCPNLWAVFLLPVSLITKN